MLGRLFSSAGERVTATLPKYVYQVLVPVTRYDIHTRLRAINQSSSLTQVSPPSSCWQVSKYAVTFCTVVLEYLVLKTGGTKYGSNSDTDAFIRLTLVLPVVLVLELRMHIIQRIVQQRIIGSNRQSTRIRRHPLL